MEYFAVNSFIEAYGASVIYFCKEKNGDHLLLQDLRDEKILVALVADGITNCPFDWWASDLACTKFLQSFVDFKTYDHEKSLESLFVA
jgi:hypothetical protein